MFDLFRRRTAKEFLEEAKETYTVPTTAPLVPEMKQDSKEYYRIGRTEDGMTTLTLMSTDGFSCTLSMNQSACKQMIRMLESTFDLEHPIEETQE